MEKVKIDARGKNCPEPVLMTKNAISPGVNELETLVDDPIARENVSRFLKTKGFRVECTESDGIITVRGILESIEKETSAPTLNIPIQEGVNPFKSNNIELGAAYTVLITNQFIGGEDKELGDVLMKAYLSALGQGGALPSVIVLMNSGVKLALAGASSCEHLEVLASKGVKILVCGTCLKHFDMLGSIGAGQISNMFEISEYLSATGHVVSF